MKSAFYERQHMKLPDSSPSIPSLEEGNMRGGIPENMRSHAQPQNKGPKKDAMTPGKEPSVAENFPTKSIQCVKDAASAVTSSPVAPVT
jgi:hypothetical protein